jgi:hypothetical protein
VPIPHPLKKGLFETTVVHEHRAVGVRNDGDEFLPYPFFVIRRIGPKRSVVRSFHADAYQVIEIAIWNALHVEEYRRAFEAENRAVSSSKCNK